MAVRPGENKPPPKGTGDEPWKNKTEWFSISGRSTDKGISINCIDIPNSPSLVVGYKREKFLGPKYATVTISNTNPYITNTGLESYIIKPKKRFIDKWYVHSGIAAPYADMCGGHDNFIQVELFKYS